MNKKKIVSLLVLSSMFLSEKIEAKRFSPVGTTIKRCTRRAEEIAEREIPKWFISTCTYQGDDYDQNIKSERLRRRHSIGTHLHGEHLQSKCELALHDLQDDGKNRRLRASKMRAADKKKDRLIREYSGKRTLSEKDKAYLLAEGVVVHDDGRMTKTKDKLLMLSWHDVNPANVDAFEWGTKFIKDCRDNPEEYLR